MIKHITISNEDNKYNSNTLEKNVLNEAWKPDTQEKIGGWLELAGIDVQNVFKTRSIEDHPYIGKNIYFKFLDDYGYPCIGKVIKCLIHPGGRLLFDLDFSDPIPSILFPVGSRNEFTLLDGSGYNQEIRRFSIDELQEYGESV